MDRTEHPTCGENQECDNDEHHEGWRHAATWLEVTRLLENGETVFDTDGDYVISAQEGVGQFPDGAGQYTYRPHTARSLSPTPVSVDSPATFLVPDVEEPPSDEEVAEAIRSIRAATQDD